MNSHSEMYIKSYSIFRNYKLLREFLISIFQSRDHTPHANHISGIAKPKGYSDSAGVCACGVMFDRNGADFRRPSSTRVALVRPFMRPVQAYLILITIQTHPHPHSRPPPPTQSGGRFVVRVFRNTLMHTQFPASESRNGTLWPDTDAAHVCTCCERVNSNINIRYPRRWWWWLAESAHTRDAHKYAPSARPTSVSAQRVGRRCGLRTQCGRRLRTVYLY